MIGIKYSAQQLTDVLQLTTKLHDRKVIVIMVCFGVSSIYCCFVAF